MKIHPVGAELIHADGRDRHEANALKNDRVVETAVTRWLITQVRELSNRVQRSSCHDMMSHLSLRLKKG